MQNNKGITLIEVVVSIALAAVVIVSVLVVVAQNATFSVRIDLVYDCANLARKQIDDLKRYNFRDLDRAAEVNTRVDEEGQPDISGNYYRTTAITEDYGGNDYLTKVKVSVDKIIDEKASGHPVIIETLFADVD